MTISEGEVFLVDVNVKFEKIGQRTLFYAVFGRRNTRHCDCNEAFIMIETKPEL